MYKPIIDEIDVLLAKHCGLTEEEPDFIVNYDSKSLACDELNAGGADKFCQVDSPRKTRKRTFVRHGNG